MLLRDVDGLELEEHKWTKKQREEFTTNGKAKFHIEYFAFVENK